ncbi:hypothetical protein FB451DRAFT_1166091 [Mycena latifolia]|nr:hypothetical protein FB451DRAFT_1166091 [Mycena latifolia]
MCRYPKATLCSVKPSPNPVPSMKVTCTAGKRNLHLWRMRTLTDPYSDRYHRFTQNLASVLHGVRLREQRERDVLRRAEFTNNGTAAGMAALCEEVVYLLSSWERVKVLDIYDQYHHSREYVMHQHYLQWQARTVYHLYHLKFLN